ncbi:MAG: class GN sortase, partial [Kiloniellales bacterium]
LIHGKAWLAQILLERTWQASLADGGRAMRPWPWADTYPVARLKVPARGIDQIVLAGASGRSLAFAPGHLDGTARPGATGHSVISGHRDTHFRFLRDLAPGDAIELQRPDGLWRRYVVRDSQVIDARDARFSAGDGQAALTLVTCYPFDAILPGGRLRYLVFAEDSAAAALGPKRVVSTMPSTISSTPPR